MTRTPTKTLEPSARTLVRGTLRQVSAFVTSGTTERLGGADLQCSRDGMGRLTMAGTGLAGAFVETAGRIFPELFTSDLAAASHWNSLTGKRIKTQKRKENDPPPDLLQSVWNFLPSHCSSDLELRQGVGIRQATGAAAVEQKALYDSEQVPAGKTWSFFMDIDTLRAEMLAEKDERAKSSERVEGIALLVLTEWMQGRCWLGANAARGMGWFKLTDVQVLRLPRTEDSIKKWPTNQYDLSDAKGLDELWDHLDTAKAASKKYDASELWEHADSLLPEDLQSDKRKNSFWYATWDIKLPVGDGLNADGTVKEDSWGLDVLAIGGHSSGPDDFAATAEENWLRPLGMTDTAYRNSYSPDAPLVTTKGHPMEGDPKVATNMVHMPIPGSGIRGPLRHTTSAWHRGQTQAQPNTGSETGKDTGEIPDPNNPHDQDAIRKAVETGKLDLVTDLFGVTEQSSRLLVCDGHDTKETPLRLACLQHHAEDEFTGGVYVSSKFNSTVVIQGEFRTRIVIEAPDQEDLKRHVAVLKPALELAKLRQVPIGKGKWSGCGWLKWEISDRKEAQAGSRPMSSEMPLQNSVDGGTQ